MPLSRGNRRLECRSGSGPFAGKGFPYGNVTLFSDVSLNPTCTVTPCQKML